MWSTNAGVSCGSSNRWWWFRCCRIKVTRQIHGSGCCCAHEEASARLHVFLICGVIILIWSRLNQTSYLQNYKIALLAGAVSGVNVSLIPSMPEGELFQKGVWVSPPFIREGTCTLCQWPSNSTSRRQPTKATVQFSRFSDIPCVWKLMAALQSRGLHKVSSHRGVFPGRCRCILAQEGSAGFLFDSANGFGYDSASCTAMQRSNSWFAGWFF